MHTIIEMGWAIGDRVEVTLDEKLYGAEVLHVHPTGKLDVRYDVDRSVGIGVTAATDELPKMKAEVHTATDHQVRTPRGRCYPLVFRYIKYECSPQRRECSCHQDV